MKRSALVCMIAAGTLMSQSAWAQGQGAAAKKSGGNNAAGAPGQGGPGGGGGRGGPGGPGGGGLGGMGGFGGMRGMMGGGGMMGRIAMSPAVLIRSEAVQKEIKLTAEQKEKLKKADEEQNQKRQKAFEDMRNQAQQKQGGQQGQAGQQGGGGRGGRGGGIDFTAMRQMGEQMAKDAEAGINKILTAAQKKRLAEIALQVEGPMVIMEREDIAKKLNITPPQRLKLTQVKAQSEQAQEQIRGQMGQIFGGGPGGPGAGGPGAGGGQGGGRGGRGNQAGQGAQQPGGNNNGGGQGGGAAQPGQGGPGGGRGGFGNMTPEERTKRMEDMRKGMEKMRDDSNKLRDKLEAAIMKVLTKRQEEAYKKMTGEKFDVDSIMATMQQGGPGGPGGGGRGGRGGQAAPPAID